LTNNHPKRCKTYFLLNLILVGLSALFFWSIIGFLNEYFISFDKSFMQIVFERGSVLAFLLFFIYLAYQQAKRVKNIWVNGDVEHAISVAKKSRKCHMMIFILLLLPFVYLAMTTPTWISYKKLSLKHEVQNSLDKLIVSQNLYHAKHEMFAATLKSLIWDESQDVDVKIIHADAQCWQAKAKHKKLIDAMTYDSCRKTSKH